MADALTFGAPIGDTLIEGLVEPPKPAPFKQGVAAGVAGVKSALHGAAALAAGAVGADRIKAQALAGVEEQNAVAAQNDRRIEDVFDSEKNLSAMDWAKYGLGQLLPSFAAMALPGGAAGLVARRAGLGVAGVLAATKAGAMVPDALIEAGSIYPNALETGVEHPELRGAVGGVTAAAFDFLTVPWAAKAVFGTRAAGKTGARIAKEVAKEIPAGMAREGAQELGQTIVERAAAGQEMLSPDAMSDYLNSTALGALGGGVLGAGVGGVRGLRTAPAETPTPTPAPIETSPPPAQPPTGEAPLPTIAPEMAAPESNILSQLSPLPEGETPLPHLGADIVPPSAPVELSQAVQTAEGAATARSRLQAQYDGLSKRDARTEQGKALKARVEAASAAETAARQQADTAAASVSQSSNKLAIAKALADMPSEVITPRSKTAQETGVPASDVIAAPGPAAVTDTHLAETAVAKVKRNLGMLVSARESQLAPVGVVGQQALTTPEAKQPAKSTFKQPDEKTRQGAIETAAVQAAQPHIEILAAAAKLGKMATTKLRTALTDIAKEAAALPTTEAAQQHIGVEVPKALKGKVLAQDAGTIAAAMINAVGQAHTLYSKGASEVPSRWSVGQQVETHRGPGVIEKLGPRLASVRTLSNGIVSTHPYSRLESFNPAPVRQESNSALTPEEFAALPVPAQNAVVDVYGTAMAQRGLELIDRLRGIVGDDPHARVQTYVATPGSAVGGYTRVDPLKSVVAMAVNAKYELSIADHEGFHYAEDRVLDGRERATVRNGIAPGTRLFEKLMASVRRYDQENKTNIAAEVEYNPAEARAYGYEFWRRGELEVEGLLQRAFEKIQQFFEKVANFVQGQGFQSIEDVFRALALGQYAERTRNTAGGLRNLDSRSAVESGQATVNIGLATNDGKGITVSQAIVALRAAGVRVTAHETQQSATEPTLVAHLDRALTPAEAHDVSVALGQEAIAQRVGAQGELYGPQAEGWRPFNAEFFLDMNGTREPQEFGTDEWHGPAQDAATLRREAKKEALDEAGVLDEHDPNILRSKAAVTSPLRLSPAERGASLAEYLYGFELAPHTGSLPATGKWIQDRTLAANGGERRVEQTSEHKRQLTRILAHEAMLAMQKTGSAESWYTNTLDRAMGLAALVHPEIATDKNARFAFSLALAVTSNGTSIADNTNHAFDAYGKYKESNKDPAKRRFTLKGYGTRPGAMIAGWKKYNELVDNGGLDKTREFLLTKHSARDLRGFGYSISALADEEVYGGHIFGPKIGGAFLQNLNGNYDALTIDRWFMRTWGRITGDLLDLASETGLRDAPTSSGQRKWIREVAESVRALMKKNGDEVSMADLQALLWYPEKEFYNVMGAIDTRAAPTDYEKEVARYAQSRGIKGDSVSRSLSSTGRGTGRYGPVVERSSIEGNGQDTLFSRGAVEERMTVGWTGERIERLIRQYGYQDGRTSGAAAWMSPADFLALTTTSDETLLQIKRDFGGRAESAVDIEALRKESQTPYLTIKLDSDGRWRATGHEGRGRAYAMREQGVQRIPIVLQAYDTDGSRIKAPSLGIIDGAIVKGQGRLQTRTAAIQAPVDLTVENREVVALAFGNEQVFNTLYSQAATEALSDQERRFRAGELEREQLFDGVAQMMDDAQTRTVTASQATKALRAEAVDTFQRLRTPFATGQYISRFSSGYKNVSKVLSAQVRYKEQLISEGSEVGLSKWHAGTQADREAAFDALMERRVKGYVQGSGEYADLRAKLTDSQRVLFDQVAGDGVQEGMIAKFLHLELGADRADFQRVMPEAEFAEWEAKRTAQVLGMIENGYVPERRYGDHVVRLTLEMPDGQGAVRQVVVAREQFEREAAAQVRAQQYEAEIKQAGSGIKVEVSARHKAERNSEMSISQFLDTARRNGITLSQVEREKLARSLISADSMRRNRMMRSSDVPGYSKEGMRVLNEFVVTMANKVAHSAFSPSVNDALDGKPVDAYMENGNPKVVTDTTAGNLWVADGPKAGFYQNTADALADRVLQPGEPSEWSSKLKGAAMVYFLGGSLGAGVVQAFSVPMNTVPWLSQHTDYVTAFSTTMSAWGATLKNSVALRDIETLKDVSKPIPAIDEVPGLRPALVLAAQDGTTMNTEIFQIMGISRGGLMAQSRTVQKAMEVWMWPFKFGEQTSRIGTFIAAYKIGLQNKLGGRALYEFAQGVVDNTQNRFDEVNRPAIASHPVGSLLFMFKSFPLFVVEMIETMYRQNPKSAVYMLMGLVAMTGVNGLPFAEDILDLVDTISQKLFGSPFNARRAMRNILKDASEAVVGADLSNLFLRGAVNDLVGLNVATRVGNGDMLPGTRMGAADSDYGKTMEQILGAPFSMVVGVGGQLDTLAKGMSKADFGMVLEALRAGGPTAVRNAIKGYEQLDKGYAQDAAGRKITDVTGPEALWQAVGISSAGLQKMYDMDTIDKQTKAFYSQVKTDFMHQLVKATRDGDAEKAKEVYEAMSAWDTAHPDMPLRTSPASMRREIVMSGLPLNERTLRSLPRQLRGTSVAGEGIAAGQ